MGRRINALRRERGWTQDYLAVHSGIGRPFLSRIENARREPCLRVLETLADAFGISLAELFRGI